MNLYSDNPQSKAMQSLIHDTNSATSELRYQFDEFEKWWKAFVKEQREKDPSFSPKVEPYIRIEYMRSRQKEILKAIDNYYTAFKNDFPV